MFDINLTKGNEMNDNRTEAEVNVENILIAECDKKNPLVDRKVLRAAIEQNALGVHTEEVPTLITKINSNDMRGLRQWAKQVKNQEEILAIGRNWVLFNSQSHISVLVDALWVFGYANGFRGLIQARNLTDTRVVNYISKFN